MESGERSVGLIAELDADVLERFELRGRVLVGELNVDAAAPAHRRSLRFRPPPRFPATLATVQMDTHFIDSAKIGEILLSRPRVIRATRSLIFTATEVTVDDRCIATASGVFKVMSN